MTITRLWHGTTHVKDADAYLTQTGLPDYRATKGNRSARILRRIEGQICHFITISEWENYESIQQFAGEEYEPERSMKKPGTMMKTKNTSSNWKKR